MNDQNAINMIQRIYKDHLKQKRNGFLPVNIIVAGDTGVGKSTLVNSVLKKSLSPVGHGKPMATEVVRYSNPPTPFVMFDTPGLEGDAQVTKKFRTKLTAAQIL